MTGIAGLATREVPIVGMGEANAEPQPKADDPSAESNKAFASILARAGDEPAGSPSPLPADSGVPRARFRSELGLATAPWGDPGRGGSHQGRRSLVAEDASSGDVAPTGLVRHAATSKVSLEEGILDRVVQSIGQSPPQVTRGEEDAKVDPARNDPTTGNHETEIGSPDLAGAAAVVASYVRELSQPDASEPDTLDQTPGAEALRGIVDGRTGLGSPISNQTVSLAVPQSSSTDPDAIGQVAFSGAPAERTAKDIDVPGDLGSDAASLSNDAGSKAVARDVSLSVPLDRAGITPRMEPGRNETKQIPGLSITNVPKPEAGTVAEAAAGVALPSRVLVTGRETYFAPARQAVLQSLTGKTAPAKAHSPIEAPTDEPETALASVDAPVRGRRPSPVVPPPAEPRVGRDNILQSPRVPDGAVAPMPSANDDRATVTPLVPDTGPPSALPAGQLQRIADAVVAATSAKPAAPDPGQSAIAPSSQPLADGVVRTLVIRLDPPDYGTVTIRLRLSGKGMALQLHAAKSETARLLNHDRDKLSAAVEAAGHEADISIVGAVQNPALPSSLTDQSALPVPTGGSAGSQLANPQDERRPSSPGHPFGDDRQFSRKDRDRDPHEAKPQPRRSGALYV